MEQSWNGSSFSFVRLACHPFIREFQSRTPREHAPRFFFPRFLDRMKKKERKHRCFLLGNLSFFLIELQVYLLYGVSDRERNASARSSLLKNTASRRVAIDHRYRIKYFRYLIAPCSRHCTFTCNRERKRERERGEDSIASSKYVSTGVGNRSRPEWMENVLEGERTGSALKSDNRCERRSRRRASRRSVLSSRLTSVDVEKGTSRFRLYGRNLYGRNASLSKSNGASTEIRRTVRHALYIFQFVAFAAALPFETFLSFQQTLAITPYLHRMQSRQFVFINPQMEKLKLKIQIHIPSELKFAISFKSKSWFLPRGRLGIVVRRIKTLGTWDCLSRLQIYNFVEIGDGEPQSSSGQIDDQSEDVCTANGIRVMSPSDT